MGELLANLGKIFAKLDASQKIVIGMVFVAIAVSLVLMFTWASKPDYVLLYSNLSAEDAAKVASYLKDAKVPYRVGAGGTSVYVPSSVRDDLRFELASAGLSGGVVGYEIFDKSGLGMTEKQQEINYKRALEGELSRTIQHLDAVEWARVHIVLPKDSIFEENARPATASVIVKLRNNAYLSPANIGAIKYLVASSVEGLTPENVTITDTQMRVLSKGAGEDAMAELTGTQIEMKRQVERYLQDKVESMLAGVLGPGKAVARVSVELDFEHVERTSEKYDSENSVIVSEQIKEETNKEYASGTAAGGAVPKGALASEKSQTETLTNYEPSKTLEKYIKPAGSIKKVSVAVVVDGTYEGEGTARQYKPRSDEEMKKIEELVKAAVGFDPSRGDEVSVANVPFSVSEYGEGTGAPSGGALAMPYLIEMGKRLGVIIFALLVLMILRSKIKQLLSKPVEIPYSVAVEGEERASYTQQEGNTGDGRQLREYAGRLAEEKPELVVRLLRNWMLEE